MAEELGLAYYHGALPDKDADQLLVEQGDFLIQSRIQDHLVLAVRHTSRIRRLDIVQYSDGTVRVLGKQFTTIRSMVKFYHSRHLETARGELLKLLHAIPRSRHSMNHEDIRLIKKIGSGAYGAVYKGVLIKENRVIAVRRIEMDSETEKGLHRMMKEARLLQLYDHPNIVKFYGFVIDRPPYLLAMELCLGGHLEDKLRQFGSNIPISRRVNLSYQAARGLCYLHSKNCLHRDIASHNCLLAASVLKLANFGMSKTSTVYKIDLSQPLNIRWLAPEVWKTRSTCQATDIFAFGILLWEMFEMPYQLPYCSLKPDAVKEKVTKGYRMPPPKAMPPVMSALMRRCLDHKQASRPNAQQLVRQLEKISAIPLISIYKVKEI